MKKMRKIFAVLLTLAMVLTMSMTAFAGQIKDEYKNSITVSNLAEGVKTNVKLVNIIYLNDNNGNQEWKIVDWATNYIEVDTTNGNYKIKDGMHTALLDAAKSANAYAAYTGDNAVEGTSCTFDNVPIGAYVVTADDAAGTYGLMVTNTYDKDGQVYMASKAANVTAKMEHYNVTKTADDKFVRRGQRVNFTVTTQMASKKNANNEELNTFKVVDTSTGLNKDSFTLDSVKIAGTSVTVDNSNAVAVKNDDGTVTYTVDLSGFISTTDAGVTVEVKYSAVVEDDHTYNNSATVRSNTVTYVPGIVNGFMGKVSLKKVDAAKDTQVLNGAEFQLLKVTPATEEGAEPTKTPVRVVNVKTGEYKVALEAEAGATTTLVATNGTLKVTGLDEGDYEFKETKAPTGYKVKPENEKFTIKANEEAEVDAGEIMFKDTKLSALPSTGGIGTTIFTIAGCLIMVTAAGLFFASRKRTNK